MPKEKDFIEKTFEEMNEMERLKYETAAELGLLDQLKKSGWKSLSASETGRLGGIMNRKIRKHYYFAPSRVFLFDFRSF